ncbi:ABC-type amino acid transport substrate-binding protein [Azospirillum fermentarium]|uniref:substrate-binding periplasmic protein n=1 Tax=Azospirillum fermentarium TaxID=1233114 RepID=UPI0022262572|nr:transporter substrate-binding domain-containing protein [Azospirillum fermentarium]MCW2248808.1 ABC-type amino acid transport substrate-binding protein [Azospirillum fermentarium]
MMTGQPLSRRSFLLAGLAAAGTAAALRPAAARPLDDVVARGRLRIAVYRDFPPFSYRADGKLTGIDVELGRILAERLGVAADLMEHTPGETVSDDLRLAVWKGYLTGGEPADVMMHVPYDKEFALRNGEAVLFAPYQREVFALTRNPNRLPNGMIATLPEGEKIGVELDTVPDFFLLGAFGGRLRSSVAHFPSVTKAVEAMRAGDVAAVLAPLSEIEGALGADGATTYPTAPMTLPGMPQSGWDIGMAVKENSRDLVYALGDVITAMDADGSLTALFARYGVTRQQPAANIE